MKSKGQTAMEYMLLFAIVSVVVLFAFADWLPRVSTVSEKYFNKVGTEIMGDQVTGLVP